MNKICLVFLVSAELDHSSVFEAAFKELGADVETVKVPFFSLSSITAGRINDLKELLREKSKDCFLIFSPGTAELFLDGPDLTLVFSAYRSWYNSKTIRVIPHPWAPSRVPDNRDDFVWHTKPPLRVGFMGTSYSAARAPNILLKFPGQIRFWSLQGAFLRNTQFLSLLRSLGISLQYLNAFPRIETIRVLKSNASQYSGIELDIVERQRFDASPQAISEYREHLAKTTYVICPRGSENYSFRMYEALNYGRVPVIVDTDMVLPKQIDWKRLALRVPYK